jgi:autotransporter-associated beta strand protein
MVSRNRRLGLEQLERRQLLAITLVAKHVSGAVTYSSRQTYTTENYNEFGAYTGNTTSTDTWSGTQALANDVSGRTVWYADALATAQVRVLGENIFLNTQCVIGNQSDDIRLVSYFASGSITVRATVEFDVEATPDVPVGSRFVVGVNDGYGSESGGTQSTDVWLPSHLPRVGGLDDAPFFPKPRYYVAIVGQSFTVDMTVNNDFVCGKEGIVQANGLNLALFVPQCNLTVDGLSWTDDGVEMHYTVYGDVKPPLPAVEFFWTQDDPTSPNASGDTVYVATLADSGTMGTGTHYTGRIAAINLGPAPFPNGYLAIRPPRATWANNARKGIPFAMQPPGAVDDLGVLVFQGGLMGGTTATLTWSPPKKTGFSPITDYVVQYSDNSGSTWTTYGDGVSTATSATVRGLASGTGYIFRVIAVNAAGNGQEALALTPIAPEATFVFTPVASETITDSITRTGMAQVVKHGGGTLILDRPNTHSGGTVVGDGKVIVRDPMALGSGPVVVLAGATLKIDLAGGNVPVGMLTVEPGGAIDLGYGRMTFSAGTSLASIRDLLQRGYGSGWNGTDGFVSGAVGSVVGGSVGYLNNADGTLTVAFGATGDVNLDGVVDILDISTVMASGTFDAGVSSTWAEGDFNYDNVVDLLDMSDFLSVPLFDAGPYIPAQASRVQYSADISPMTAYDSVFLMLASEEGIASNPSVKKPRLVKALI